MALRTFRDAIRSMVPWWAGRETGRIGKVLYAIGLHVDALVDAHVAAIKIAMPGLYSPESLPLIGRERRIRRGPLESDEVFASRLPRWWEDHKRRGGPYALLEQARAYWSSTFQIDLVYITGRRFIAPDDGGAITRDDIEWSPPEPTRWARWWLFYFWPEAVGDDGVWGDAGTYGDGGVWGSDLTVEQVANIRAVPTEWNAKHCSGSRVVLLNEGTELWGYPAGDWGDPGGVWGSPAQLELAAA